MAWRFVGRALAVAALVLVVKIGLSFPRGDPESADSTVDGSPKSLATLFQRECLDQAELPYLQAEAARRKAWICPFDDGSSCISQALGVVRWNVKSPPHTTVEVNFMDLDADTDMPSGDYQCNISVSENLGRALLAGVASLNLHARPLIGPIAEKPNPDAYTAGIDFAHTWKIAGHLGKDSPVVTIVHLVPIEEHLRRHLNFSKQDRINEREMRALTWLLDYSPGVP